MYAICPSKWERPKRDKTAYRVREGFQCCFAKREAVPTGESQNHRIVGVGRDLCGSSSPTPLLKQKQNHRMVGVGRDLWDDLVQLPCQSRVT